jgi:hypothetical protein
VSGKTGKDKKGRAVDSDDEDEDDVAGKIEDIETKDDNKTLLSPEDSLRQGELAEGVQRIKASNGTSIIKHASFTDSTFLAQKSSFG